MKVKFCCENNANIHSKKVRTFDTVKDFGMEDGEWESMTDEARDQMVWEWACEDLSTWWEEA